MSTVSTPASPRVDCHIFEEYVPEEATWFDQHILTFALSDDSKLTTDESDPKIIQKLQPHVVKFYFGLKNDEEFLKTISPETCIFYEVYFDTPNFFLMKNNFWIKKVVNERFEVLKYVVSCPSPHREKLLYSSLVFKKLEECLKYCHEMDNSIKVDVNQVSLRIQIRTERSKFETNEWNGMTLGFNRVEFLTSGKSLNRDYYLFFAKGDESFVDDFVSKHEVLIMKSKIVEFIDRSYPNVLKTLPLSKSVKYEKESYIPKKLIKTHLKKDDEIFVPISDDERPTFLLEKKKSNLNVKKILMKMCKDLESNGYEIMSGNLGDVEEYEKGFTD
jgi:hypothetical protein